MGISFASQTAYGLIAGTNTEAPSLFVQAAAGWESDEYDNDGMIEFHVLLGRTATAGENLYIWTEEGDATAYDDYDDGIEGQQNACTVPYWTGVDAAVFVSLVNDPIDEEDEHFNLCASYGTRTASAVGTIFDDDEASLAAVDDEAYAGFGDEATIYVLGNDQDPGSHGLTITGVTQGNCGTVTFTGGSVSYTPYSWFTSGVDVFEYTMTDGYEQDTAQVTVTMIEVTSQTLQWETPDETWETVGAYEVAWDDDVLRWTAEFSPVDPPEVTYVEWWYAPWAEREDPESWELFTTASGDNPVEANPGVGDYAVKAIGFFENLVNQYRVATQKAIPSRYVVGRIESVEWVGVDPGDGQTNLEEYPAQSGQYRIYPERNHPEGTQSGGQAIDQVHDEVKVKVTLTQPVPAGWAATVYLVSVAESPIVRSLRLWLFGLAR